MATKYSGPVFLQYFPYCVPALSFLKQHITHLQVGEKRISCEQRFWLRSLITAASYPVKYLCLMSSTERLGLHLVLSVWTVWRLVGELGREAEIPLLVSLQTRRDCPPPKWDVVQTRWWPQSVFGVVGTVSLRKEGGGGREYKVGWGERRLLLQIMAQVVRVKCNRGGFFFFFFILLRRSVNKDILRYFKII